ncbi:MAG TPA: serine--tRNA ligase [Acidimicrobiales bacterium]|nr:serine--tRNA ligase [Acidimicrobiales bacterium]
MIDIRRVRSDLDGVKAALTRRGVDPTELDRVAQLDERHRQLSQRRDDIRARVKSLSQSVAQARRAGDQGAADAAATESRALGEEERAVAADIDSVAGELRASLLGIPNIPDGDAPDGDSAEENVVVRTWTAPGLEWGPDGSPAHPDHQRIPHWDVGAELGILDLERGAKLSGTMFPVYRGMGAALIRALTNFALDHHGEAFEEIRPPSLVRTETMVSTGHLPKFEDDAYHLERDDLWAIPTAEVPLTSLGRDEILVEADLPVRMTAATPCYRREAGSAGRDTRGLLRVHEFDKVEILAYCTPDQAPGVHADLLARAEALLQELELTYRVVDLCAGDLGQSSARTFDLEAYAPGSGQWLEVSSVSWFSDYQARRANVRYRPTGGSGTAFVHTLNGSALAWPRVWATIVETHRKPDGSVAVPVRLRPYLGGAEEIGPNKQYRR